MRLTVYGPPKGAQRHRSFVRGGRVATHHAPDHLDAEERVRRAAVEAWAGRPPLDEAVTLTIETWHKRPARLCRRMDRGSGPLPFTGKPDADNVAKLVMDGLTKAGVWTDDTRVADLVVRRRWLPLSLEGQPVGVERVEVTVLAVEAA